MEDNELEQRVRVLEDALNAVHRAVTTASRRLSNAEPASVLSELLRDLENAYYPPNMRGRR